MPMLISPQAHAPAIRSERRHDETPKVEIFLGYSHFRGIPTQSPENRMVGLNGGQRVDCD